MLYAALALNNQHSRFTDRAGDVFRANGSVENIPRIQHDRMLFALLSIAHFNPAIQHNKNFLAVVACHL